MANSTTTMMQLAALAGNAAAHGVAMALACSDATHGVNAVLIGNAAAVLVGNATATLAGTHCNLRHCYDGRQRIIAWRNKIFVFFCFLLEGFKREKESEKKRRARKL